MAPLPTNPDELLQRAGDGDRRALARALSIVERGGPSGAALIRATWVQGRGDGAPEQAFTVGITGAPGAGKSTLSASLCGELLRRDRSVAVLAIDPSSPFSGGAILGDRVRMGDVAGDDDVYIRSMATRGNLGGLAGQPTMPSPSGRPGVMGRRRDRWGRSGGDRHRRRRRTTVVVVNPGWGDAIQANKAG
jgi:LAO/AO transport system kinase